MSSARPTGAAILTLLLAATAACPAAVRAATPEPPIVRDCADCPELVVLPAGAFLLGTSADAYEHDKVSGETPPLAVVIRRPFALGRFEVQVQEWRRFVAATGYRPAHACALDAAAAPAAPARCVTAADAEAYLEWLGRRTGRRYRLPSESEWEYAARAATTGARFWSNRDSHEGVSISRACDFANVHDVASRALQPAVPHARCIDHYTGPAPVGSFAPNPWGLYDLVGNVRELLADCYTRSYKGRPPDDRAWTWSGCSHRAVRGGSWLSRPLAARSAARDFVANDATGATLQDVGFRVARDVEDAEASAAGGRDVDER
ncbi:MAG TPA: SUMF1/EgtB/PvdO family nonheme iron enzyme [Steroidobacteraceae bacterium]|nr:SUMF1/EgtB/PvdO family nonheme iron enzyme [Steroidobacteraceae bacterium]